MIPSEKLRFEISNEMKHDLTRFAWGRDLKNFIYGIDLSQNLENGVTTMEQVYEQGLNVGHCGLASRYVARAWDEADVIYGKFAPLAGTNKSPEGAHAWIYLDGYVVDTTLMIAIPANVAEVLGYEFLETITSYEARQLEEQESFSRTRDEEKGPVKILTMNKPIVTMQKTQVM